MLRDTTTAGGFVDHGLVKDNDWFITDSFEFLGRSNGVGFKIHLAFSNFDVTRVLAWSLAFVTVMLAIDALILRRWEARANRWRQDAA